MRIKKIDDSFCEYRVEMSFGQLKSIRDALEEFHADPILDELYQELTWYLQNVPGPGESTEEFKAREQGEAGLTGEEGTEAAGTLPPPPEEGAADLPPEGDMEGEMGSETGPESGMSGEFDPAEVKRVAQAGLEGGREGGDEFAGMGEGPEMTPDDRSELERRLPTPPAE